MKRSLLAPLAALALAACTPAAQEISEGSGFDQMAKSIAQWSWERFEEVIGATPEPITGTHLSEQKQVDYGSLITTADQAIESALKCQEAGGIKEKCVELFFQTVQISAQQKGKIQIALATSPSR